MNAALSPSFHHHPCTRCGEPVECDGTRCGTIYHPETRLTCGECTAAEAGEQLERDAGADRRD